MSVASKLFGVWVVNKTVTSATPLFIRLLVGMAAITVYAIAAFIVMAILMIGIVWIAYERLLQYGIDQNIILLIIGSLLIALLSYIIMSVKANLKKIYAVAKQILYLQSPLSGKLSDISNAFLDGFNSTPSRKV